MLFLAFPDSSVVKESTCNARDPSSIPESERERQTYDITYVWNLEHDASNVSMKQKQTHRQREETCGAQGVGERGREGLGVCS